METIRENAALFYDAILGTLAAIVLIVVGLPEGVACGFGLLIFLLLALVMPLLTDD